MSAVISLAASVLLGSSSAGASSSKQSAKQWAGSVCSAFLTFGESVQSTISGLKSADSVESAANSAKQGIQDATKTLEDTLDKLGKPPTPNAKQAQSTVQGLANDLSKDADDIEQALTPTPSTPTEAASAFATIGSDMQKAVSQTQSAASTLKGLKGNNELKQGFQSAPSCKQLKSNL